VLTVISVNTGTNISRCKTTKDCKAIYVLLQYSVEISARQLTPAADSKPNNSTVSFPLKYIP